MNDESSRIRPASDPTPTLGGIEWEFHPQEHDVVVHVPDRRGGSLYTFGHDDGPTDVEDPLHRRIVRALLENALRELDATEPVNPNGLAR